MSEPNVLHSFNTATTESINVTLNHLERHINAEDYAIVGGLAIRHYVSESGQQYPPRPFNDLDVIALDGAVNSSIAEEFAIAHCHKTERGHYLAIVDKFTGIKVDIFDWPASEPSVTALPCGDKSRPFQSREDQLATTILDTTKVFRNTPVEMKQFDDALRLLAISNLQIASEQFRKLYGDRSPHVTTVKDALEMTRLVIEQNPHITTTPAHPRPENDACEECINDERYPLTPLAEVYKLVSNFS